MPVVRVCFKQGDCHKVYKKAWKDCLLFISIFYMVFILGAAQSAAVSGLLEVSDSIGGIGAVNTNSINAIYNKDGITIWEVTPNANYPHTTGLKFYAKLDDNSDSLSILLSCDEEQASLRGLIPSLYDDDNYALSTTPDEYHYCYEYTKSKTLIYAVLMDTFSDLKAKSVISQAAALANNPSYKCSFTDKVFILGYYFSAAEYDNNWLCFHNWPWGDGNDLCKYHPEFRGCEYSDGWVNVDLSLDAKNTNNYYIYGGIYNDNSEESRISVDNAIWLQQINWGGKNGIKNGKANIPSKITLFGRKTWSVTSAITWMAIDADSVGATGHMTGAGQTNVDRPEELDVLERISLVKSPLNWLPIEPDMLIYGRVFNKETDQPLNGAILDVVELGISLKTDKDGLYKILGTEPSRMYTIKCSADGYKSARDGYPNIGVKTVITDKNGNAELNIGLEPWYGSRMIKFSNIEWIVDESNVPSDPGKNYWSDSIDNVWIDVDGKLHIKITKDMDDAKWYCTSITTVENQKYGEFVFDVGSRLDILQENVVLGFFNFKDNDHEIDIEFGNSIFGISGLKGFFSTKPTTEMNVKIFDLTSLPRSINSFDWVSEDLVIFKSDHLEDDWPCQINVPKDEGKFKTIINLWFEEGQTPDFESMDEPEEIIINSVEIIPQENDDFSIITNGYCPIDMIITDPDGLFIDKQENKINGAIYIEVDINGDLDPDDQIIIPHGKIGIYTINIIPEPDSIPTDTYTLEVISDGNVLILAKDVQIKDIPNQPYIVEVKENGEIVQLPPPDLNIDKIANLSVGAVSAEINFSINVTNTGGIPLTSIKVVDAIPKGMSFKSSEPTGTAEANNVTWNLGPLAPGSSNTIHLVAQLNGEELGILTNEVNATGAPEVGNIVFANATAVVTALEANITVEKTANLSEGAPGARINFTIKVENTGDADFVSVDVEDLLPEGLDYVSDDSGLPYNLIGSKYTWNLEALAAGVSKTFNLTAEINGEEFGDQVNVVNVTGYPEHGDPVQGGDSAVVAARRANISMEMTADPELAALNSIVTFTIRVTNTGEMDLDPVVLIDELPAGLTFVSAEPAPDGAGSLRWDDVGPGSLGPGESTIIKLVAMVDGDARAPLINHASASGCPEYGNNVSRSCSATLGLPGLSVNKTAEKNGYKRGEEIVYTIEVTNLADVPVYDVVVRDVFSRDVEFVSADPAPDSDGVWRFDVIPPKGSLTITLMVLVPDQEFEFDAATGVSGEGFVNVAGYYSTTLEPYSITNRVSVTSASTTGEFSASETVNVLADPGTELETREHGSGAYESDEIVRVRTENKSISMDKDVAATYAPTSLGLYNNRTVAFSSRWTEEARAKNRVTSTSMSESYRYATFIDRESRIFLDENQSVMEVESEFDGMGSIGFLKMPSPSDRQTTPLFEGREEYRGSFKVVERIDEYGSGVSSEKAASGSGLVVVDKRLGESQRSYESGTGSYDSEELIETYTSYIAKDISLVHAPMNQSFTDDFSFVGASMKWKEGMYSKVPGTSYIGEEYTSIAELDKETVAKGLNEMDTLANFSGSARYRAIVRDEVDFDEAYAGDYSVERRVILIGTAKYDRPHLNVTKTLDGIVEEMEPWGYNETHLPGEEKIRKVATYTIAIENDGNAALGPIYVKDLFPPGAIFKEPSSLRPMELTGTSANWTLTHLGIGDVVEITLQLDVTKRYPQELTNRVQVCGGINSGAQYVCASNFSALELNWLSCCESGTVSLTKTAELDGANASVVWYRIDITNHDNVARVATVTDHLPEGMIFLDTMVPFASYDGRTITWNLIEIAPLETVTIPYRVSAQHPGRFVNSVEVDPRSVDGPVVQPIRASSVIEVGEPDECESTACGLWSPPAWDFEYVGSFAGEMTCEDLTTCVGGTSCPAA